MGKKGHVPVRMCIGCRSRRKKEELVRLTRNAEGGRGLYLCPDADCLRRAQKRMKREDLGGLQIQGFLDLKSLPG
jgi:uncharacterized protein